MPLGSLARPAAVGLAVLAIPLAFVNLWRDWYTDPYFAATVQSMRASWRNFFYLSSDPAGFVSVDKPPLALWLQAACTEVLGLRPLSLLLPAALAGLASLVVLYHLVRRTFGVTTGLLATLFLALTPIVVATDRSNNMDSLVMLTSLLGAWAVPLAVLGLAAAVRRLLERPPVPRMRRGQKTVPAARSPLLLGREGQALLLWGAWLLSLAALYSVSSYFHPYNLVMVAPAIAAMAAIGLQALWREYRRGERGWWYLPGSLALTGLVQAAILLESPDWNRWLLVVVLAGSLGAAGWLVLAMSGARRDDEGRALLATALGTAALLVAPALWASVPVWHYGNVEFPIAGPDLLNPAVEAPAATRDFLAPPILTRYLLAQRHGERYIMAARYGSIAAPLILATGRAVLTYGGYLGEDRILDVPRMAELVRRRQVRLFWMLNARAEAPRAADIEGWVAGRCALVPAARWQVAGQYGATGPRLFDCGRGGSRGQPDH